MYIPEKRGYDIEALAKKSKGNTERIFALRHKASGLYFRSHKGSRSTTVKPFAMSKAVSSYYYNEFAKPEEWELVRLEVREFSPLTYDEMQRIKNVKYDYDRHVEIAEDILEGNEGYDGADGARYMLEMCDNVEELLKIIERLQ